MNIIIKDVKELSKSLYISAINTTIRPYSVMRDVAVWVRNSNGILESTAIILLDDDNNFIGWSMINLLASYRQYNKVPFYVNIRRKYRRKGYGKTLFNAAKNIASNMNLALMVCPHDELSRTFFKKLNIVKSDIASGYSLDKDWTDED